MTRLILASASTSRRRLLESAGLKPEIIVSHVDEETEFFNAMSPADMVIALAITKAHTVREQITGDAVIEPSQTREYITKAFRSLKTKRDALPPRKHGNIPL